MSITPPCEISVKEILPAIRSIIATKLVKDRGMPIYRAAILMGVTPAAVANYMNGKRGNLVKDIIENDDEMMEMIDELVKKIGSDENNLSSYYCILCSEGKKVLKRNGMDIPLCIYETSVTH
ncbi:transcriptional regulator [Candidatus Acidianus copahuensis]|uniref:Transcriptional regulator n=1 Tax=Candidatus Acidianus copahuensis TaxID=1160895 RepID=A0A031LQY1_9CREN|nr:transcriptional regulator [Candidatus Acidianus copahuensis]EZQ06814.1 transcriptional regulator [Candidatus Acidianus copahuensis]NON61827.1 transcriptional regulator [Acidianus sp. RZ1]